MNIMNFKCEGGERERKREREREILDDRRDIFLSELHGWVSSTMVDSEF